MNPRVLLRLNVEKNTAVSNSRDIRYDIGPWSVGLGATYFTPPGSGLRLGAGVSAGYAAIHGRFEGPQFAFDTGGSTLYLRATGEMMWPLGSGWFVTASAGVRYARVPEVKLEEQVTVECQATPLETWKDWLASRYVFMMTPYLSQRFVDARFEFFGRFIAGQPEIAPRWKGAVRTRRGIAFSDVIVAIDGARVRNYDDFYNQVDRREPGQKVKVSVQRGDERLDFEVELMLLP